MICDNAQSRRPSFWSRTFGNQPAHHIIRQLAPKDPLSFSIYVIITIIIVLSFIIIINRNNQPAHHIIRQPAPKD